jgi:hypothetical protein
MILRKKKSFFYRQNEEVIFDDNKLFKPKYSTEEAEIVYEDVIKDFKSSKYFKKLENSGINIFSVIYQDLFWHYCFNFVKYRKIFSEHNVKDINFSSKLRYDNLSKGINKVLKYLEPNKITYVSLRALFKYFYLKFISCLSIINFVLKNVFKKKFNKIWIYPDLYYHNNFKFLKSKILSDQNCIVINQNCFLAPEPIKFFFKNLNHSIYKECKMRLKNYFLWSLIIYILRPKKIILQDNLFNDYSILLAAKKYKIPTVGVTHGLMTKFHKGNIGSKETKGINLLKFDKIYVWTDEFKKIMEEKSYLYAKDEILVSGWLSSRYDKKRINLQKKTSSKNLYILHAFEINSNFNEINKILKYFNNKGYKIILKRRYPYKNYTHFDNIFTEVVDDFTNDQVENSFCAVCNASTFYYNFLSMNVPIVLPRKNVDGYNFFSPNDKNIFEFSNNVVDKIKKTEDFQFILPDLKESFLKEFQ